MCSWMKRSADLAGQHFPESGLECHRSRFQAEGFQLFAELSEVAGDSLRADGRRRGQSLHGRVACLVEVSYTN